MLKIIFSTIAINNGFGVTDPKGECVNWRFLYTKIPQITLSHFLLLGLFTSYLLSIEMLRNIIFINCNVKEYNLQHSTIAFLRSRGLSSFQLHSIQQITNENLLTKLYENGYSIRPIEMSNTSLSISAIPQYQKSHLRPFFIAVASLGSQCPITFSSIFQQTNFAQFKHLITCSFQKTQS